MSKLSHYSKDGTSTMVDVSEKESTRRMAKAAGFVEMSSELLNIIEKNLLPKGNLFEVAKIAGIMAAKRNAELIPMCHPFQLSFIDVDVKINLGKGGIDISSEIRLKGKTGAEMEALAAVSIAALTVYDMCKAVDKNMVIKDIKLLEKTGGKSGHYVNEKN